MILFQSQPEFPWISVIALLTHRFEIHLIELSLDCHFLVTGTAGEMVDTPGLVQGSENITLNHLVTDVAEITKQLMVVSLTVGKSFPLIVSVPQERFLTLGTNKVFHMPVFA